MNARMRRNGLALVLVGASGTGAGLFAGGCSGGGVLSGSGSERAPARTTIDSAGETGDEGVGSGESETLAAAARMRLDQRTGGAGGTREYDGHGVDVASIAGEGGGAMDGVESLSQLTLSTEGADFDPQVSRNGKWLVFASTQHSDSPDVYIKSTSGRTVTQLTADPAQDVMPSLSPDGSRVAFASDRGGNWDIYVMSSAGGRAVRVTSDPADELHPSWSPDGTRLVFCRLGATSGRWEVWTTGAGGGMSGGLGGAGNTAAEFVTYGLFPQWCPAQGTGEGGSDKILFQRSRQRGDRAFSLWTVDYRPGDVSPPTEIVAARGSALFKPTWSPDGLWIAYSSSAVDGSPARSEVMVSSLDGSVQVSVVAGAFRALAPTWSADGRLYFVSDRGGTENIWSVGTDRALAAARGGGPGAQDAAMSAQVGGNAGEGEGVAAALEESTQEVAGADESDGQ